MAEDDIDAKIELIREKMPEPLTRGEGLALAMVINTQLAAISQVFAFSLRQSTGEYDEAAKIASEAAARLDKAWDSLNSFVSSFINEDENGGSDETR